MKTGGCKSPNSISTPFPREIRLAAAFNFPLRKISQKIQGCTFWTPAPKLCHCGGLFITHLQSANQLGQNHARRGRKGAFLWNVAQLLKIQWERFSAPKCQGLDQSLTWQIASVKVMMIFHFHYNKSFPLFVRFMDITSCLLYIRKFPANGRDSHWKRRVHALDLWFWCQISTWILQIQEESILSLLRHHKALLEIF